MRMTMTSKFAQGEQLPESFLEVSAISIQDLAADHHLCADWGLTSQEDALIFWQNVEAEASANLERWRNTSPEEREKAVKDFIESYDESLDS